MSVITRFGLLKRKVKHPTTPESGYTFHQGRLPTAGAEDFVFEDNKPLPIYRWLGAGTACGSLRVVSGPQIFVGKSIPTQGLGGIQAGQFVSAPLLDDNLQPLES